MSGIECLCNVISSPDAASQNLRTRLSTTSRRRRTGTGTATTALCALRFRNLRPITLTNAFRTPQYQEAEGSPIPIPQWYRPQVPKEPQICATRDNEGSGTICSSADSGYRILTSCVARGEGGQAGARVRVTRDEGCGVDTSIAGSGIPTGVSVEWHGSVNYDAGFGHRLEA